MVMWEFKRVQDSGYKIGGVSGAFNRILDRYSPTMIISPPTCQSFFSRILRYTVPQGELYDAEYHNVLSSDLDAGLCASTRGGGLDTVRIGSAVSCRTLLQ